MLRVFHYGDGVERQVGYALYEDAAQYDAMTLPTTLPTLVFQGDQDTSVDPAMVQLWAQGRSMVDLRMLHDGHQLTDSMDFIWAESAPFLGLSPGV
jgi:alpha-beta hydrolase superfamily lysophospholipase